MTTTAKHPELSGWAHRRFGLMPPAKPDHVRRAWAHKLAADGFYPPLASQSAWAILRGDELTAASHLLEEALLDREQMARQEVDELARSFFTLTPFQRRARLTQLRQWCEGNGPLTARLAKLEPAVNIEPSRYENTSAQDLSRILTEIFVLPPSHRATRRREILCAPPPGFVDAAQLILDRHPELTTLDEELINGLTGIQRKADTLWQWQDRQDLRRQYTAPATQSTPQPTMNSWSWLWLVLAVVGIIRLASSCESKQKPAAPWPAAPNKDWR